MPTPKNSKSVSRHRLPSLLRFLGLNMLLGAAIAIAFVSVILLADIGGLKDLIIQSSEPVLPLFLIYAFHVFTFSGVTMGVAIMTLPYDEPPADAIPAPKRRSKPSMTLPDPDHIPDDPV